MYERDIVSEMVAALSGLAPAARAAVEAAAREAILASDARTVVTFVTPTGRRFAPAMEGDYVKALWCFLRNKPFNGEELDTALSAPVARAAEAALLRVMSSAAATEALAAPFTGDVLARPAADQSRALMREQAGRLRGELLEAANLPGGSTLEGKMAEIATDQAIAFFHTAAGAAVIAAFAKIAATTAGKVAIANILKLAFLKLSASVAFKTAMLGLLKKIGVVVLVKAVLIKVIAAAAPGLMAKLAAMHIPVVGLLIAGGLAAFIAHDIATLPEQLARKAPPEIGKAVEAQWPDISRQVVQSTLLGAAAVEVKTARRNRATAGIVIILGVLASIAGVLALFL